MLQTFSFLQKMTTPAYQSAAPAPQSVADIFYSCLRKTKKFSFEIYNKVYMYINRKIFSILQNSNIFIDL